TETESYSKWNPRASSVIHLLVSSQQVLMVIHFPSVLQLLPECFRTRDTNLIPSRITRTRNRRTKDGGACCVSSAKSVKSVVNSVLGSDRLRGSKIGSSFLQKPHRCFRASADLEFFVAALQMIMHRPHADTKHLGDLFIDVTFADIAQDFVLAICELKNSKACFRRGRILEETLEIIGHLPKNLCRREVMQ